MVWVSEHNGSLTGTQRRKPPVVPLALKKCLLFKLRLTERSFIWITYVCSYDFVKWTSMKIQSDFHEHWILNILMIVLTNIFFNLFLKLLIVCEIFNCFTGERLWFGCLQQESLGCSWGLLWLLFCGLNPYSKLSTKFTLLDSIQLIRFASVLSCGGFAKLILLHFILQITSNKFKKY